MSTYSLDEDNKRIYKARATEWEEKANEIFYNIDLMSHNFKPKFTDSKPIYFNRNTEISTIPVKRVGNSKFNIVTDVENTRRNKAVRMTEKNLTAIKEKLTKEFKMPQIAVVDFNKHGFGVDAIGGYDSKTGILYINSKYDTTEKVLEYVNRIKGMFANTTEYAPYLHELGHKYYYDKIKQLAESQNIEYNKAKKTIDNRIYDYIHSRNNDGKFLLNNLSIYANMGYAKSQYTEVIAEAFSVLEENLIAKELIKLME